MTIPDDWQPPPCKHGAKPRVGQEFMDWNYGTYMGKIPSRKSLWYDCPTPDECICEQYALADKQETSQ